MRPYGGRVCTQIRAYSCVWRCVCGWTVLMCSVCLRLQLHKSYMTYTCTMLCNCSRYTEIILRIHLQVWSNHRVQLIDVLSRGWGGASPRYLFITCVICFEFKCISCSVCNWYNSYIYYYIKLFIALDSTCNQSCTNLKLKCFYCIYPGEYTDIHSATLMRCVNSVVLLNHSLGN